ncbi:hypothetical protein Fmac_026895 [Flemingia macrophylla]|uniref:Uncharacterized protein n=1 Tax=Flemingia macrophylla TaxID=520843 RepID=A0ABD1LG97_9FABA
MLLVVYGVIQVNEVASLANLRLEKHNKAYVWSFWQVKRDQDALEITAALAEFDMLDSLAYIVNKILCKTLDVLESWVVELFGAIKKGPQANEVFTVEGFIWKSGKVYWLEAVKDETEKIPIQMVEIELEKRKQEGKYRAKFKGQSHFFGTRLEWVKEFVVNGYT